MGIFNKLRGFFGRGKKPVPPNLNRPAIPETGGHRGIATGKGPVPATLPTNRATIPASEVEDFVYGGQPLFVNSSNVAMAQYFPTDRKLMIEYLGGSAYLYSDVTAAEAISLAVAQSKGIWVWTYIRVRGKGNSHKSRKPFVRIRSVLDVSRMLPLPEAEPRKIDWGPKTQVNPPLNEIDLTDLEPLQD